MKNKYLLTKHLQLKLWITLVMMTSVAFVNAQTGYISNVTGVSGACVQSTINGNNQFWDVAQGGTYEITLSGVTDCANNGNDLIIQVIVKSSHTGNTCLTAVRVGLGVYKFVFTMDANACATLPILYCTAGCSTSTGDFAMDATQDGIGHLRTTYFDGSCNRISTDNDCETQCTFNTSISGELAICAGESTELCADAGVEFLWSNGSTDPCITVSDADDYSVVVFDANGCSAEATITVVVNTPPTVTIDLIGEPSACAPSCVPLSASGADSYVWSPNGEITDNIEACSGGSYSVIGTDANGCTDASDAIDITIHQPPVVEVIVTGEPTACAPNCVTLTASGAATYVWSPNGEITSEISACESGDYSVTGTDVNGCTNASASVTVTIFDPPTVEITPSDPDPVCEGTCVTLTASGALSYVWFPNGEITDNIEVCETGEFSVVGTDGNGCTASSASVTVTVNPNPSCDIITPSPLPVFGLTSSISATVDCPEGCNCTYTWALTSTDNSWVMGTGQGTTTLNYTTGNNGTVGHFELTITCTETGCSHTCELDVTPTALESCSYTQGFYGNGGKALCLGNIPSNQAVYQALNNPACNPIVIGYGTKTITFGCLDTACIRLRLPAGGPAAALTGSSTCATAPSSLLSSNGTYKNVFIGQTLTLALNMRLFPGLGNIPITSSSFTTYKATACINGNAVPGTAQTFTIPQDVITCLGANNKISDLLVLANKKLGGQTLCSAVSLGEINDAVDAVNRGFDECRLNSTNAIRMAAGPGTTGGSANLQLITFPNPTNGDATIEFISGESQRTVIDIYNINGSLAGHLFDSDVPSNSTNQINFSTNDLLPGIYFIRVTNGSQSAYTRLVKIQ